MVAENKQKGVRNVSRGSDVPSEPFEFIGISRSFSD